jgi:hypothetical protein
MGQIELAGAKSMQEMPKCRHSGARALPEIFRHALGEGLNIAVLVEKAQLRRRAGHGQRCLRAP